MDKIGEYYVYCVPMNWNTKEMVAPCVDGHTIYINDALSQSQRIEAFKHAVRHTEADDFCDEDIQEIESRAHEGGQT